MKNLSLLDRKCHKAVEILFEKAGIPWALEDKKVFLSLEAMLNMLVEFGAIVPAVNGFIRAFSQKDIYEVCKRVEFKRIMEVLQDRAEVLPEDSPEIAREKVCILLGEKL